MAWCQHSAKLLLFLRQNQYRTPKFIEPRTHQVPPAQPQQTVSSQLTPHTKFMPAFIMFIFSDHCAFNVTGHKQVCRILLFKMSL